MNLENCYMTCKTISTSGLVASLMLLALIPISAATAQQESTGASANTTAETISGKAIAKPTTYWPEGIDFDTSIPTPEEHFGFDVGERHLSHAQVAGYMRLLANSSDRISIAQYGMTHGHRPLLLLTITSSDNRDRLDEIQKQHLALAGEESGDVEIENLPAVINMGYGVHGDEPSATNCSPLVAFYLAAAKGEEIENLLSSCVILLDPSLNPDGFNRFANWANRYRGVVPNPDPQHAEHNQMWPPGRVNYYWFDLNRDWLPLVHPESQSRMTWYHSWKPNVVLDFHEMGTGSTYFFQPGIPERTNPLTPAKNLELTGKFATYHSKALDDRGSLYFTKERFDDFYMGKGSTYPDLHGAVGILFEQASSRGHVQRTQDGLLTFHQTIANQFTTSLSSLRATADMREELLRYKRGFYRDSLEKAKGENTKYYVFTCRNNRSRLKAFADVLLKHDISCFRLKEDYVSGDRKFDARWSVVVPLEQSEYRFLKSLLMRKKNFQENIFYDVSAWTLSLAYGLGQTPLNESIGEDMLEAIKLDDDVSATKLRFSDDDVTYLVDWREDGAAELLARLHENEIKVRVALKPLKAQTGTRDKPKTKSFGTGTLSIVTGVQADKREMIEQLLTTAAGQGVKVTPVRSGLAASGIDIGSPNFPSLEPPQIAMAVGRGASAYGAGEIWHLLDQRMHMPITLLKTSRLETRADLDDYNTFVLASGSYSDDVWNAAEEFAADGGTVIVVGRAATTAQARLNPASGKGANTKEESETSGPAKPEEIQKPFASASNTAALQLISGAIFKTRIDATHPLMFGLPDKPLAVFRDHASMLSPSGNPYANPAVYDQNQPLMAGYCSEENIDRIKGSASMVVIPKGRGRFILLADNPNFRGFWRSTSRVFLNGVFFGKFVDP